MISGISGLVRLNPVAAYLNGGFGKAYRLTAEDLGASRPDAYQCIVPAAPLILPGQVGRHPAAVEIARLRRDADIPTQAASTEDA
jgi:hypothetical protein